MGACAEHAAVLTFAQRQGGLQHPLYTARWYGHVRSGKMMKHDDGRKCLVMVEVAARIGNWKIIEKVLYNQQITMLFNVKLLFSFSQYSWTTTTTTLSTIHRPVFQSNGLSPPSTSPTPSPSSLIMVFRGSSKRNHPPSRAILTINNKGAMTPLIYLSSSMLTMLLTQPSCCHRTLEFP